MMMIWFTTDLIVTYKPQGMEPGESAGLMGEARNAMYGSRVLLRKFFKTLFSTKGFMTAMWATISNKNYAQAASSLKVKDV